MPDEIRFRLNTLLLNSDISADQELRIQNTFKSMAVAQALRTLVILEQDHKLVPVAARLLEKIKNQPEENFESTIEESLLEYQQKT